MSTLIYLIERVFSLFVRWLSKKKGRIVWNEFGMRSSPSQKDSLIRTEWKLNTTRWMGRNFAVEHDKLETIEGYRADPPSFCSLSLSVG